MGVMGRPTTMTLYFPFLGLLSYSIFLISFNPFFSSIFLLSYSTFTLHWFTKFSNLHKLLNFSYMHQVLQPFIGLNTFRSNFIPFVSFRISKLNYFPWRNIQFSNELKRSIWWTLMHIGNIFQNPKIKR